jgi:excisionase family DNA binding protein
MSTSTIPEQLLSREQTAAYLNLSASTLDRLISSGDIIPIRLSRRSIRFSKEAIDQFQQKRTLTAKTKS